MTTTRRQPGKCQDCGWSKPVRTVTFWVNGYQMRLCAQCERVYRTRLVKPASH